MSLILVIGGTRSGKSVHAERLVAELAGQRRPVRYVATAGDADSSMAERIAIHVARRPASWETVVAGDALVDTIADEPGAVTLIDGLGGWVAGVLHRQTADVAVEIRRVVARATASGADADLVVVAEEAGQGLLPMDRVARSWLDQLGLAVQALSAAAARVDYVVAGRAIPLPADRRDLGGLFRTGPGKVRPSDPDPLRYHGDRAVRVGDLDHAVNVLESGPPAWLKHALTHALETDAARYPNEDVAREAIAGMHGRATEEIVLTNGAAEALWLLGPALRPRLAVCVHPGFTESEAGLIAHGIPVQRVYRRSEQNFALDPTAVPDEADLVIVGNPASPSGTLDPAAAILALRRPGRMVVVDEAFMAMVPGEPGSLSRELLPDVIVIRSLTKLLSVPGVRVGYAIAPPALSAALMGARPPWSVNAMALAALDAAAAHPHELAALAARAAAEGDDLYRRLSALDGFRTHPTATNFCLIEVADSAKVVAALQARGIAVRPAASFPGLRAGHIRITARDEKRNEMLAAALTDAVL